MSASNYLAPGDLARLARLAAGFCVMRYRLTGGEPLLRRDIVEIVALLRAIDGVRELSMTTNGLLLPRFAADLRAAGLRRVNVSLDTLRPERYREICRGGEPARAFEGTAAAEAAGLLPVKINMVVIPGVNDGEVEAMARLTLERPCSVCEPVVRIAVRHLQLHLAG